MTDPSERLPFKLAVQGAEPWRHDSGEPIPMVEASSEIPAPEISAADLVRASVVYLAQCITADGWSEHVLQAMKNVEAGLAILEGEA